MNAPNTIPFRPEGPQPLVRETETTPYPIEALGPLQEAAKAAQHATQAPMALAGQSALSVASLAVQCHANVETLGGSAPVSLFCLTVARSGERKSATDKLLMRGVLEHERGDQIFYEDQLHGHDVLQMVWKADRDAAMGALKSKDNVGARADLEAVGAEPPPPLKPFLTTGEPTLEGLHRMFAEGQPGLGLFSDEGGAFFGGHAMSADNRLRTMTGLSDLWGGEPIKRVRGGDGSSALYGRRLSSHLMLQPIVAASVLDDPMTVGQGFLPRFLIANPKSAIGFREVGTHVDEHAIASFAASVRGHLKAPKPVKEGTRQELEPRLLSIPSEAREVLLDFAKVIEAEQAPGGSLEGVTAFASKAPEQACRIAGVMTLWENRDALTVDPYAMVQGIELAQYHLAEARCIVEGAAISRETAEAEKLRAWLIEKWPAIASDNGRDPSTVLKADIVQRGPGSIRESRKAVPLIKLLMEAGWLVQLDTGSVIDGKSRKEAWRIVRS